MARLRILAYLGLGIIGALCLLPPTNWIIVRDVRFLSGGDPKDHYGDLDPAHWAARSADDQLAIVIHQADGDDGAPTEQRIAPLRAYCDAHPDDVRGWGFLVRIATMVGMRTPPEAARVRIDAESARTLARVDAAMMEGIDNGERLQPDNLFFTLTKSMLLESNGRHADAQRTLLEASHKREYDDFTRTETELTMAAASRTHGDQGMGLELLVRAGILFPHLAPCIRVLPSIVDDPYGKPIPRLTAAAVRSMHTMAARTSSDIGAFSAKTAVSRILAGGSGQWDDRRALAGAIDVDKALGTHEVEVDLMDFEKVRSVGAVDDAFDMVDSTEAPPLLSSYLLLVLLLCAPTIFGVAAISRIKDREKRHNDEDRVMPRLWNLCAVAFALSTPILLLSLLKGRDYGNWPLRLLGDPLMEALSGGRSAQLCLVLGLLALGAMFLPRRGADPSKLLSVTVAVLALGFLGTSMQDLSQERAIDSLVSALRNGPELARGGWEVPVDQGDRR